MNKPTETCALGAVISGARQLCRATVNDFCREAGITVKSYYRLMHKKRHP
jgi:hypothetical protein